MSNQSLSQSTRPSNGQTAQDSPVFDNRISTLLAEACQIAADRWNGNDDIDLAERIAAASTREAIKTAHDFETLADLLAQAPDRSEFLTALLEACYILKETSMGRKPACLSRKKVKQIRETLLNWYIHQHFGPAFKSIEQSADNSARQNWINQVDEAIEALSEWRAVLLGEHNAVEDLATALEYIEAAGLLNWLESIGDVDALLKTLAGGEK